MADAQPLFADGDRGTYVAFRWTDYDVPFWARENSRDGRWNRAGQGATQYWSLTPEAAWAELIRAENLQTEDEVEQVRMPLWVARVPSLALIDLRLPEERDRHGVTESDLTGDRWEPCQDLAQRLREGPCRGVIAPSAALADHASLTLFGRRRAIGWTNHPALASTVPATQAAVGRPPADFDLLRRTRRRLPPGPLGERLF